MVLSLGEPNPGRFSLSAFRQCRIKHLDNTASKARRTNTKEQKRTAEGLSVFDSPRLNPQTPTGHFGNIATRILPENLA